MPRRGDYLFKRKGSQNWWIRFQYPAGLWGDRTKKIEHSLGTPDRALAEIEALGWIKSHKFMLISLRAIRDGTAVHTTRCLFPTGSGISPHGEPYFATKKVVHYLDVDGEIVRTVPNEREMVDIPHQPEEEADLIKYGLLRKSRAKAVMTKATDELAMHVERWLTEGHKTKHIRREAEGVLAIFRETSGGKPLKDCTRADGVKLREHLFGLGNKSQTAQKKLGHLCAALNYSAREYDYVGPNPFKALVSKEIKKVKRDSVRGLPFSEEDMAKVRGALPTWTDAEAKLLWVLCATTGMRRGEAFLIEREERIGANLRCITLMPTNEDDSIKTDESERTIPIPDDAIPHLPKKITGRLFTGTPKNVGKRLMRKLRELGVTGRGKSLKSTRHRAARRIQNTKLDGEWCPDKLRYQILGHEIDTVADGVYARGFPQDMLKPWIDVIGLGPVEH